MAIKTYKPTTPSRRQMTCTDYSELSKVAPEKSLLEPATEELLFATEAAAQEESIV